MTVFKIEIAFKSSDSNITAIVKGDNRIAAIKKLLDTTPGLKDFYQLNITERADMIIVE